MAANRIEDEIDVQRAAKILRMKPRNVQKMCQCGDFKTAHKPGHGKHAWWKLSRLEVVERKMVTSILNKS